MLKELPEVVAKVQCEVDPCRPSQDDNAVTKDVTLTEPALVSIV